MPLSDLLTSGAGDWITVVTNATGTFTGELALPDGTVVPPGAGGAVVGVDGRAQDAAAEHGGGHVQGVGGGPGGIGGGSRAVHAR